MTAYRRLFDPPSQDEMAYVPDPLGRLGMGTYEEKQPRFADPGWGAARDDWMNGASLPQIVGVDLFSLRQDVGREQPNRRADVFKLQALLHKEGHLDAEATGGPTGYWGGRDDKALRAFQTENGLTVDGYAAPEGESINTMRGFYKPAAARQYAQAGDANRKLGLTVGGVPPIPRSKKDIFARPENAGAWNGFHDGLRKESPNDPGLHGILAGIYAEEGGRLRDLRDSAVGGILPDTLDDMRQRHLLDDLPPDLRPEDLTPQQQAHVYRVYFDDVLHTVGGAKGLAQLDDPELARAVADTLFLDGRSRGALFLQQAINKTTDRNTVSRDGAMGPQTLATLQALARNPGQRDRYLNELAETRIKGKARSQGEIDRINRLRNASRR